MDWDEEFHPLLNKLRDAFRSHHRHYIRANSANGDALILSNVDSPSEAIEVPLIGGQFNELVNGGILDPETRCGGIVCRAVLKWDAPPAAPIPSTLVNHGIIQNAGAHSQLIATQNVGPDVLKLRDELLDLIREQTQTLRIDVADLLEVALSEAKPAVKKASIRGAAEMLIKIPDALLKLSQLADRLGIGFPTF